MANPEYQDGKNGNNVVETLALILSGRVSRENLDENDQSVLGFYLNLMDEDLKLKNEVTIRKQEIMRELEIGRRVPLFTDEELENARKHKKHRKHKVKTNLQPELFKVESSSVETDKMFSHQSIVDPEEKLTKLHREFQEPRSMRNKNSLVKEDIGYLKLKLRNIIGLPIARGKDPHVNDRFYTFLVRRIVHKDAFRIFDEFRDFKHDEISDLDTRIDEIKNYVSEALGSNSGSGEKYIGYNKFADTYNCKWWK